MLAVSLRRGQGRVDLCRAAGCTSSRRARARGKAGRACSSAAGDAALAHRIYQRVGFRRAPERDWSPVPGMDLLAFTLALLADGAPAGSSRGSPKASTSSSPR